jgi:hypothetical protein
MAISRQSVGQDKRRGRAWYGVIGIAAVIFWTWQGWDLISYFVLAFRDLGIKAWAVIIYVVLLAGWVWRKLHGSEPVFIGDKKFTDEKFTKALYDGNCGWLTFCSNVSAVLSMGVIASFLMVPASTMMITVIRATSFDRVPGIPWATFFILSVAPAFGLACIWWFGEKVKASDNKRQWVDGQYPMTYLNFIKERFGQGAAKYVFTLMMMYMILVILGEAAMFRLAMDELFYRSGLPDAKPVVVACIAICFFYVRRNWYRSVLETDHFQLIVIIVAAVAAVSLFGLAHGFESMEQEQRSVFTSDHQRGGYMEAVQQEFDATRRAMPSSLSTDGQWRSLYWVGAIGAWIIAFSWLVVAPNSWVLNVSTWQHGLSRQPDHEMTGPKPGGNMVARVIRSAWDQWRRWLAVLTRTRKKALWCSGIALFGAFVCISYLGFRTSQTAFRNVGAFTPDAASRWRYLEKSQTQQTARALASLEYVLQRGPLEAIVGALVCVFLVSCFHTTFDTAIVTVVQLINEAFKALPGIAVVGEQPLTVHRVLDFLTVAIPFSVLLPVGRVNMLVWISALVCWIVVLLFLALSLALLSLKINCRWVPIDGWTLLIATVTGCLVGLYGHVRVWMFLDDGLVAAGIDPRNSFITMYVFGAWSVTVMCVTFLSTALLHGLPRRILPRLYYASFETWYCVVHGSRSGPQRVRRDTSRTRRGSAIFRLLCRKARHRRRATWHVLLKVTTRIHAVGSAILCHTIDGLHSGGRRARHHFPGVHRLFAIFHFLRRKVRRCPRDRWCAFFGSLHSKLTKRSKRSDINRSVFILVTLASLLAFFENALIKPVGRLTPNLHVRYLFIPGGYRLDGDVPDSSSQWANRIEEHVLKHISNPHWPDDLMQKGYKVEFRSLRQFGLADETVVYEKPQRLKEYIRRDVQQIIGADADVNFPTPNDSPLRFRVQVKRRNENAIQRLRCEYAKRECLLFEADPNEGSNPEEREFIVYIAKSWGAPLEKAYPMESAIVGMPGRIAETIMILLALYVYAYVLFGVGNRER